MSADKMQKKEATNRGKISARLMAVQAIYEAERNEEPLEQVLRDYLDNRAGMDIGGQKIAEPDRDLFLSVARGVQQNRTEIDRILESHASSKKTEPDAPTKDIEPLLKSILSCGVAEILSHTDIDAPVIINDYIDVARAFYDKGQVSLVNGVLDSVAGILRS